MDCLVIAWQAVFADLAAFVGRQGFDGLLVLGFLRHFLDLLSVLLVLLTIYGFVIRRPADV